MKKSILLVCFLIFNVALAQRAKYNNLYLYTYIFPVNYFQQGYDSYGYSVEFEEAPKKILIGDELIGTKDQFSFNTFFNDQTIAGLYPTLLDFNHLGNKANNDMIIAATIKDVHLNVKIQMIENTFMDKDVKYVNPYENKYSYDYVINFKIKDTKTGNIIQEINHKVKSLNDYNVRDLLKDWDEVYYHSYEEAKEGAIKFLGKHGWLSNEAYKNIISNFGFNSTLKGLFQVRYSQLVYAFYSVGGAKKNDLYLSINKEVEDFIDWGKERTKSEGKKVTGEDKDIAKASITGNVTVGSSNNNSIFETSVKYREELFVKLNHLIAEMNAAIAKLDQNDKKESKIVWVCLFNIMNAYYAMNEYDDALKYAETLSKIDYKQAETESRKRSILYYKRRYDVFFNEDKTLKDDIHNSYKKYLKK